MHRSPGYVVKFPLIGWEIVKSPFDRVRDGTAHALGRDTGALGRGLSCGRGTCQQ
jgi:hypothetical protein